LTVESQLNPPSPLEPNHQTQHFNSGTSELDIWLRDWALVNHRIGNARVFVATRGQRVVGYYALSSGGIDKSALPERMTAGGVPGQVPVLLLARLAVDSREQGNGLGRGLLVDTLRRSVVVASEVGVRALLIHARDQAARDFYLHHAEFVASPTDPLHLLLHMKQVRRALGESS